MVGGFLLSGAATCRAVYPSGRNNRLTYNVLVAPAQEVAEASGDLCRAVAPSPGLLAGQGKLAGLSAIGYSPNMLRLPGFFSLDALSSE